MKNGNSALGRRGSRAGRLSIAGSWIGAATLALAAACTGGGRGGSAAMPDTFTLENEAGGNVVGGATYAELELTAPAQDEFVLRGTVPLPPGVFPRADGKIPFSIRDGSGYVVPTQVEIVSRYPDASDGADVVEVLARVARPSSTVPGQKIRFPLVAHVHGQGKLPIKKGVLELLTKPQRAMLVARDVFGHEYRIDLFEGIRDSSSPSSHLQKLRRGPAAVQMRTYGVMKPTTSVIGPPNGALPHFFGVHAYTTAWAREDFVSLEVRVNNGASGADKTAGSTDDNPLGDVYFKDLELWVPLGWQVLSDVSDPCLGAASNQGAYVRYPLIRPNADGSLHLMTAQAMFHRRLSIAKPAANAAARATLDQATLAFAKGGVSPQGDELWSWWNDSTARYFIQKQKMPDLSHVSNLQGSLAFELQQIKGVLESGSAPGYPFDLPNYGWAHPYGVAYGGMTSGSEIWFYDGFKAAAASSREGYRARELSHRMYVERQPQVLYDADGEQTRVQTWLVNGSPYPYVPMNYYQKLLNNSNDPFGMNVSPAFQRQHVQQQGRTPSYEAGMRALDPIDFQHYSRFVHSPMVLAWLGNDALAKDDLRMAAEVFRMSYHEWYINAAGGNIPTTLSSELHYVTVNPGRGMSFGRGESWGLVSASAAYSLSDDAWRQRFLPWFQKVADVVAAGQIDCSGFIQSQQNTKWLAGQWKARQSIEQAITENALWGMKESVFRNADPARFAQTEDVLVDSLYAMIGPMAWTPSGPWSHLAVAPLSGQPFCGTIPSGGGGNGLDNYQTPSSYAYGYQLTGDATFLTRAAQALAGGSPNLLDALEGQGQNNLENKAALIAVLQ
jgi:hypothetical protein